MLLQKTTFSQILAMFPVSMAYFASGLACGWVSPTLHRYKDSDDDFSLTTEACSLIAGLHYVGRAIGCTITAMFVNKKGRCLPFYINGVIACTIWIAVISTKYVPVHYAIRITFGIGLGSKEVAAPFYMAENCSPNLRGIFSGVCITCFYAGELVEFAIGASCSYETVGIINLAVALIMVSSLLLLREPAQHLLAIGKEEKAEKRFFELRGHDEAAKQEFADTKQKQRRLTRTQCGIHLLADQRVRAVVIINCLLYLTGYPVANAMPSLILSSAQNLTPNELTIFLASIILVSICFSTFILEMTGRRTLLIVASSITILSHLIIVIAFICEEQGTPLPYSPWIIFSSLTSYSITVAAVLFPLTTTIRGELLSPKLKPFGSCTAIVLSSLFSVILAGASLSVAEAYGMKTNFVFFAIMGVTMLLYVYFDLPETRGLTLTEIQKSIKIKSKKTKVAKESNREMSQITTSTKVSFDKSHL